MMSMQRRDWAGAVASCLRMLWISDAVGGYGALVVVDEGMLPVMVGKAVRIW